MSLGGCSRRGLGERRGLVGDVMPRTPAKFTQADIARVIRAVAQARVKAVVEVAPDGTIRVLIGENVQQCSPPIEPDDETIIL